MCPTASRVLLAGLAPAAQVLQEIGHPKKTRQRKWHLLKGVSTMSNSNMLGRQVVHGEQSKS
jgi:hypothetical protein